MSTPKHKRNQEVSNSQHAYYCPFSCKTCTATFKHLQQLSYHTSVTHSMNLTNKQQQKCIQEAEIVKENNKWATKIPKYGNEDFATFSCKAVFQFYRNCVLCAVVVV